MTAWGVAIVPVPSEGNIPMRRACRHRRFALAALPLLFVAGCGPSYSPVQGRVTYPDGEPLTEGMVVFESKGVEKPITARGEIAPDGRYQLGTVRPGGGVPPGTYRVLVTPRADPNAIDKPAQPPPFHQRYMAFDTSGLEFEVRPGTNDYPIQVARPGKSRR
jgi:hypothetical protein